MPHQRGGLGQGLYHGATKNIDIGYGYTADQGATYPFRGKGVGLIPSLDEVLEAFPDGSFLIHIKSTDPEEGNSWQSICPDCR